MSDRHGEGMRIRREVLGEEHVAAAVAGTTADTAAFQDLITRYAWGEIWARPGLDRRTRSAITLMALIALNREHELAMHIRAALRNGLSREEIATACELTPDAVRSRIHRARLDGRPKFP